MADVMFTRIAPVISVRDLDAALARYRQLGFAIEMDESAQHGYVERGAVQLHLVPNDPHDAGSTGGVAYLYVSDADALHDEWTLAGVQGRFSARTTRRTVPGNSYTSIPTAPSIESVQRMKGVVKHALDRQDLTRT